jgi:hypothetical protein
MDHLETSVADDRQRLATEAAVSSPKIQRTTQKPLLTISQAHEAQWFAPKVYTYKKKVVSTTRAVTMRVDQFGNVSRIRPHPIKPSELTGWVITHVDPPISNASTAPAPKDQAFATPASANTTATRKVYTIEHLTAIGKTGAVPPPSHATLITMGLTGCLKALGEIKVRDREQG